MAKRTIRVELPESVLGVKLVAMVDGCQCQPVHFDRAELDFEIEGDWLQFIFDDRASSRFGAVGRLARSSKTPASTLKDRIRLKLEGDSLQITEPCGQPT